MTEPEQLLRRAEPEVITRPLLLALMVALPVLGVANAWYFGSRLDAFLRRVPELRRSTDLEAYKCCVGSASFGPGCASP